MEQQIDPKLQQQMEQAQAQEQKKAEMDEAISSMMKQILSDEARERLNNIKAAKPEKAEKLQGLIIGNANTGRIQGKVTDDQLIDLIDQLDNKMTSEVSITYQRKNLVDSDDDLDLDEMF